MIKMILALVVSFSSAAFAQESAVVLGMQTTGVSVSNDDSASSVAGFQAGWMGFFPLASESHFRAGVLYAQRKFEGTTTLGVMSSVDYETELQTLEVPIAYLMRFNEAAGVFGGVHLGVNLSDRCTVTRGTATCDLETKSLFYGVMVGGSFQFHPNYFFDLSYIHGLSDLAKDVKLDNSITVNFGLIL